MIPAQKTEKGRDLPSPRTRRWKIALYIRLSRDDGNDESLSVSNQRKILLEYAEQAFGGEDTLTDIYIDDGRSGTDAERPDFQRMIRDAEAGRVNCIICKNLSRAFRNYADQGYYLEKIFPGSASVLLPWRIPGLTRLKIRKRCWAWKYLSTV